MAKNRVQFQKGLSIDEFLARYGSDTACHEALFRWRWPEGFHCPSCGFGGHCRLQRGVYQCNRCKHQTSVTSSTIFHASKLPLRTWFLAMHLMTASKNGIAALELHRQLGISYNAAWRMKHKLMQVMKERDDRQPLHGLVQIDDVYWGGERHGGKRGRGAPNKVPFVVAVAVTDAGQATAMRLSRLSGFRKREVARWAKRHLRPDTHVVSDGLACFRAVREAGCSHTAHVTGGGPASVELPDLRQVNTMIGNVKNAIRGTYHALRHKHLPRYLAEFCYRFNRRYRLDEMLARLAYAAVRTAPMPERLLKVAEPSW